MGLWHSLLYDFGAHLLEEINTPNDKQAKKLDFGFDQSPWSSAANNLLRACHDSFPCISVLFSFQLSTSTKLIFQAFSNKLN
jgi:hypothetical protein